MAIMDDDEIQRVFDANPELAAIAMDALAAWDETQARVGKQYELGPREMDIAQSLFIGGYIAAKTGQ